MYDVAEEMERHRNKDNKPKGIQQYAIDVYYVNTDSDWIDQDKIAGKPLEAITDQDLNEEGVKHVDRLPLVILKENRVGCKYGIKILKTIY